MVPIQVFLNRKQDLDNRDFLLKEFHKAAVKYQRQFTFVAIDSEEHSLYANVMMYIHIL